ncbi:MAG: hypothetical protein HYX48_03785 [Chlamydiales bacterium]|nr:hypothetical protein [Chlamydiales bacterium]
MRHTIFLFGEAEKGDYCTPIACKSLPHLVDVLGHPPSDTLGIPFAIQTLLYEKELIFFRVKEEGFSTQDYMRGLKMLRTREMPSPLTAICMPGVGDAEIIDSTQAACQLHKSFLIITQKDLYDYLMTPRMI